jgi:formylglycine-generating enzyme
MNSKQFLWIWLWLMPLQIMAQEMALVKGGEFLPLYGAVKDESVKINDFYMDVTPVTHKDFLEFVKAKPQWQKSNVKKLFADERYLNAWTDDFNFSANLVNSPVNNVSWFAAKAYCECQGKRLPTVDEWEYAAMASENKKDARADSLYNSKIIKGYEKPKTHLNQVGHSPKNFWGIQDLHGMVWEWTQDFNSVIITGESRNNGNNEKGLFCASGAVGANDLMNYAAFMRYAIRASLKANYTVTNKGFRCVKDATPHYLADN